MNLEYGKNEFKTLRVFAFWAFFQHGSEMPKDGGKE